MSAVLNLLDILSYAVSITCEFSVLCAITRVGRGWLLQFCGLFLIVALDVTLERWRLMSSVSLAPWLTTFFSLSMIVFSALVFALSRYGYGQRLFLALLYGTYAAFYASVFHLLAYRGTETAVRNVFGLPPPWADLTGLAVIIAANAGFVFWVLPRVPRDGVGFRWTEPCCFAGAMFLLVYGSGIWPISIVDAPFPSCLLFAFVSVAAWVLFPILCRHIRDRQRNAEVEHSLNLMTTEVKMRRAAIDEARRMRHDQRHHRAQVAEYLLLGQTDRALAYLDELDEAARATPTDRLIWCENETVNAILSVCSRKAAAQGVGFSAEADVNRPLGLSEVETVAVIANLVENAIEACERGEVTLRIRQHEFGFGVTVSNPVPMGFALSATGLPCDKPGVGLESVRRVIERHRGTWTYAVKDDVLKCQVILMPGE